MKNNHYKSLFIMLIMIFLVISVTSISAVDSTNTNHEKISQDTVTLQVEKTSTVNTAKQANLIKKDSKNNNKINEDISTNTTYKNTISSDNTKINKKDLKQESNLEKGESTPEYTYQYIFANNVYNNTDTHLSIYIFETESLNQVYTGRVNVKLDDNQLTIFDLTTMYQEYYYPEFVLDLGDIDNGEHTLTIDYEDDEGGFCPANTTTLKFNRINSYLTYAVINEDYKSNICIDDESFEIGVNYYDEYDPIYKGKIVINLTSYDSENTIDYGKVYEVSLDEMYTGSVSIPVSNIVEKALKTYPQKYNLRIDYEDDTYTYVARFPYYVFFNLGDKKTPDIDFNIDNSIDIKDENISINYGVYYNEEKVKKGNLTIYAGKYVDEEYQTKTITTIDLSTQTDAEPGIYNISINDFNTTYGPFNIGEEFEIGYNYTDESGEYYSVSNTYSVTLINPIVLLLECEDITMEVDSPIGIPLNITDSDGNKYDFRNYGDLLFSGWEAYYNYNEGMLYPDSWYYDVGTYYEAITFEPYNTDEYAVVTKNITITVTPRPKEATFGRISNKVCFNTTKNMDINIILYDEHNDIITTGKVTIEVDDEEVGVLIIDNEDNPDDPNTVYNLDVSSLSIGNHTVKCTYIDENGEYPSTTTNFTLRKFKNEVYTSINSRRVVVKDNQATINIEVYDSEHKAVPYGIVTLYNLVYDEEIEWEKRNDIAILDLSTLDYIESKTQYNLTINMEDLSKIITDPYVDDFYLAYLDESGTYYSTSDDGNSIRFTNKTPINIDCYAYNVYIYEESFDLNLKITNPDGDEVNTGTITITSSYCDYSKTVNIEDLTKTTEGYLINIPVADILTDDSITYPYYAAFMISYNDPSGVYDDNYEYCGVTFINPAKLILESQNITYEEGNMNPVQLPITIKDEEGNPLSLGGSISILINDKEFIVGSYETLDNVEVYWYNIYGLNPGYNNATIIFIPYDNDRYAVASTNISIYYVVETSITVSGSDYYYKEGTGYFLYVKIIQTEGVNGTVKVTDYVNELFAQDVYSSELTIPLTGCFDNYDYGSYAYLTVSYTNNKSETKEVDRTIKISRITTLDTDKDEYIQYGDEEEIISITTNDETGYLRFILTNDDVYPAELYEMPLESSVNISTKFIQTLLETNNYFNESNTIMLEYISINQEYGAASKNIRVQYLPRELQITSEVINPIVENTSIQITITDKNTGKAVSGIEVSIKLDDERVATGTTDENGQVTLKLETTLDDTTYTIIATDKDKVYEQEETISIEGIPTEIENTTINTTGNLTVGDATSLTATFYTDDNQQITSGKAIFKVNGKTLRDDEGNVIYIEIIDGRAELPDVNITQEWTKEGTTIQAVYIGDDNNEPITTKPTTVTVTKPEATITLEAPSEANAGTTITLKATVTDGENNITSGRVAFKLNGKTLKDPKTGKALYANVENGVATITYTIPEKTKAKEYTLTAVFTDTKYDRVEAESKLNVVKA